MLLAEYNALYTLAEFRMAALDRRVPAAGAAILASVGVIPSLASPAQHVLLAAVPASLIWLLRTTINHARSFEDAIRRIEQLETALNSLAGTTLMCFQSTHPSRGRAVGGRTGTETVLAVVLWAVILLGACGYLVVTEDAQFGTLQSAYLAYLGLIGATIAVEIVRWRRYRYRRTARSGSPGDPPEIKG